MRWILRFGYGAILLVAILSSIALYQGWTTSKQATETLQATLLVIDLIREYVNTHDGAWPRSWNDLEQVTSPSPSMFDWPADVAEVQQRVEVDFAADPQKIAEQTPEDFTAVLPIGPYFEYKDRGSVRALIDAIGEHR